MYYAELAGKALSGRELSRQECRAVLGAPRGDLLPLLDAAFRVRRHHFGTKVRLHVLQNAKSGLCPEDCGYCSQSAVSEAPIDRYPLRPKEELLSGARRAAAGGAARYCIVTSGRGPTDAEIDALCEAVREIRGAVDLEVCCCLGLLDGEKARRLKAAGVGRINHNLNTSRRHHPAVVGTHTYDDRLETLRHVREAGLDICSGGIIGMGESPDDVIDLARALRALEADSIPVNFLHPIEGTPMAGRGGPSPLDGLRTLCLFRFLNPDREVRVAGGRERNLRSLQPLALYPANSVFMEGYLTTSGQSVSDAHRMIEDLGFEVERASRPEEGPGGGPVEVAPAAG